MFDLPPTFNQPLIAIVIQEKTPSNETSTTAKTHTVVAGDNLTKLAEAYQTSVERLWSANPDLADPNHLEINQELKIPSDDEVLTDRPMPVNIESVSTHRQPSSPQRSGGYSSSGRFKFGWCTYLADQLRPDIGASGNANTWIRFANSKTPQVGAIAVNTWGLGHVAYVVDYNATQVLVKHMNWHGFGVTSTDWIDRSYWQGYIY